MSTANLTSALGMAERGQKISPEMIAAATAEMQASGTGRPVQADPVPVIDENLKAAEPQPQPNQPGPRGAREV